MRLYASAASLSGLVTFVAVIALRAPNATIAVGAIAGVTALAAWLSTSLSTQDDAGLALSNPAWTLTFAIRGRRRFGEVLPLWAAQLIGALIAALIAHALASGLPDALVWASPTLRTVGIITFVLAIVSAWVVCAADTHLSEGLTAVPVLAAGALLPLTLASTINPAAVFGLTVAGFLDWTTAVVAAGAGLVGGVAGAYTAGMFTLAED